MATPQNRLHALAETHGIERGYRDIEDRWVTVGDETLAALLTDERAMRAGAPWRCPAVRWVLPVLLSTGSGATVRVQHRVLYHRLCFMAA